MAKNLYDPKNLTSITAVTYAVSATGNTWFNPTIGTSDSADYTADKTEAVDQCLKLSPLGEESVV